MSQADVVSLPAFLTLLGVLLLVPAEDARAQSQWPQFRGPDANPTAENPRLPDRWSTTENVEWSVNVPGRGWSSPIELDGRVYLTTVTTAGESKEPQTGTDYSNQYVAELMKQGLSQDEVMKRVRARDIEMPSEVQVTYWLLCLDLETGKEVWKQQFHSGRPPGGRHRKNSFCSETPVTDGENIYIYIANLGLFAYDQTGKQLWSTPLKSHPIYLEFGTGSSPILHDGRLIIVHDNEAESFIAAFDCGSGQEIWRTPRQPVETPEAQRGPVPKSGWVTPFLWENDIRTEIVTVRPGVAISYDLSGKELWRLTGVTVAPASSSFAYRGLLMLDGGKRGPIAAIRPGATGTMDAGEPESSEHIVWTAEREGTYIPTPVAYQGGLYVFQDKGIVARFDVNTGEETFKKRLSSKLANVTSSPWAYNGLVFCLTEQGDTFVLKAGTDFELVRVNALGDFSMATPAIVGDRLLVRTEKRLYSIRSKSGA